MVRLLWLRPFSLCAATAFIWLLFLCASLAQAAENPPLHATITVDASTPVGRYTPAWNYFGADEPNYTYAPNGTKLLHELAILSPAPVYIRVHNLLTTGNGQGSLKWGSTNAYTEDAAGQPVYDWTITDRIFDAFRDAGVRPIVEIGFMPEALSTRPEPYRHTFPKGDVFTGWSYPPKDYGRWSALVSAYATHLQRRYGASVDSWLWEIWNEPDIAYWHGTPEEYNKLYDISAAAILKALPHAKIGGPESTGPYGGNSEAFLRQFLEHCARGVNAATGKRGAPLDFISFHPKGDPKVIEAADGRPRHIRMDIGHQLRAVDLGMRIVASFPEWRHTPIILGESDPEGCAGCGVAQNPQNGYRNGPLYGVSVAEATARTYELGRRNGVNLQGAVTWAFEFEDQPAFAGFRELATHGIDKAVLNVFRMWGMLGGEWVQASSDAALPVEDLLAGAAASRPDLSSVATRQGGEIRVLAWNYSDQDTAFEPAEVSLRVTGLRGSKVRVQRFLVDQDHANAYQAWQRMGSPAEPSAAQQVELIQAARLAPAESAVQLEVKDHAVTLEFPLACQGVTLVRLTQQ